MQCPCLANNLAVDTVACKPISHHGNWSLFPDAHVKAQRYFSLFLLVYAEPFNGTLF